MRALVEEVVHRSCVALDDLDFAAYLALCADEFRYTVQVYAPEIRREMVWLDHDKGAMEALFTNLPRHHSDRSPLTRHATVQTIDLDTGRGVAAVVSGLQVYRTTLDGGETALFAVGRMLDEVVVRAERALLTRRAIRLTTRALGAGSHIPLSGGAPRGGSSAGAPALGARAASLGCTPCQRGRWHGASFGGLASPRIQPRGLSATSTVKLALEFSRLATAIVTS